MLIDRLINDTLQRDPDAFYKARILASIIVVYLAIITLLQLWMAAFAELTGTGRTFGIGLITMMQAGFVAALLILKKRRGYRSAAHLTIAATLLGISAGIAVSGGPLHAPAIAMNMLPILMAFVLVGKRGGLLWTQLVLLVHAIFLAAESHGLVFMQMLTPAMMPIQHLAHWLVTYSAMVGLLLVYDMLNNRLKSERDSEKRKFEHLATHDPLTNLANRLYFDQSLGKAISRSRRSGKPFALLIIDLDGFKPVNDTLGHDAGDIVLQEISHRLRANVRDLDTIARLGGDEFGVLLEDLPDGSKATMIAEKLRKALARPVRQLASRPAVSGSIGIALYPGHAVDKESLLKCADLAMYAAKQTKNSWRLFDDGMSMPE